MQGALLTWLCFTNPVILPAFVWCGLGWGFWLPFAAHTAMPLTDRITVPLLPYNLAAWVESLIHYSVFSLHNSFYSSQALTVQIVRQKLLPFLFNWQENIFTWTSCRTSRVPPDCRSCPRCRPKLLPAHQKNLLISRAYTCTFWKRFSYTLSWELSRDFAAFSYLP